MPCSLRAMPEQTHASAQQRNAGRNVPREVRRWRGVFGNSELSLVPDRERSVGGRNLRASRTRRSSERLSPRPRSRPSPCSRAAAPPGRRLSLRVRGTRRRAGSLDVPRLRRRSRRGVVIRRGSRRSVRRAAPRSRSPRGIRSFDDAPPFISGLVGFLSYETVPPQRAACPGDELARRIPGRALRAMRHDRRLRPPPRGRARDRGVGDRGSSLIPGSPTPGRPARSESVVPRDQRRRAARCAERAGARTGSGSLTPSSQNVRRPHTSAPSCGCEEYIEAGDCQQVVVSQRFPGGLDIDPFAIYQELRLLNPSPYLFYFEHDGRALVGSSPEALAWIRGSESSSSGPSPARGPRVTAPRGRPPRRRTARRREGDRRARDARRPRPQRLGRVAELGTVRVDLFRRSNSYSHVMHMVSQVRGRLSPRRRRLRRAARRSRPGTVTGAPKVRAMQFIAELERRAAVPTPGASATSVPTATWTSRSPSARSRCATGAPPCRPAPASSPTPTRDGTGRDRPQGECAPRGCSAGTRSDGRRR